MSEMRDRAIEAAAKAMWEGFRIDGMHPWENAGRIHQDMARFRAKFAFDAILGVLDRGAGGRDD